MIKNKLLSFTNPLFIALCFYTLIFGSYVMPSNNGRDLTQFLHKAIYLLLLKARNSSFERFDTQKLSKFFLINVIHFLKARYPKSVK